MQIYVASFGLLFKEQLKEDRGENDNTMSQELQKIFQDARHLLCDIEEFINATSSRKIGSEDWIKKREMKQIIQFKNLTNIYLHRTYVKGRFQNYIQKLYKRIVQQSSREDYSEKSISYPKYKSLKKHRTATRRAHKGGKKNNRQNGQNGHEVLPTKRVHIVRTSKQPGQTRITKNNNNINRNRRRQRTTTTPIPKVN